ncbi:MULTISPECIES: response regulator transcription factor [Clostridium]|uniref:response regulator transcription factor n=1 Tax=Clostridium TaxID=1485 RepID=UPI000824CFE4|nr:MULTISPECIES: response regulator transcription factor [Clostridium]PJI09617.1 DNA-binding response regulator [Clostridium sp. CT7]
MDKNILIVEDEDRMMELIKAYLKREGYGIIEAADGRSALDSFSKNSVSLVILDIMIPVLDGWTVCGDIRKKSDVPIIILTAKNEEDDKLLGYELGADDYVTKPFSPKVLTAKVKVLLKRARLNEKSESQEFDGLKIDEISHEVMIGDKEIYLSPKEYDLLIYLCHNKGIALTRDKILDNVWGKDYYGDFRTVDTHVKRLREKLQDKSYLVATVRGSGYKFEVKK